ncbi:T9SS type A sorting domain-containing protein [Flavobacterium sp.]
MKALITLLLSILFFSYTNAQAPAIEWQKSFGGSSGDGANSIQLTADGGYIVAGSSSSLNGDVTGNHGAYDCWIIKLDATGTIHWEKSFGGTDNDYAGSILITSDGGYIVASNIYSTDGDITENKGDGDCWIIKLDDTGSIQWQKSLGGTQYDYASSIQATSDNGYIIAGYTASNNGDVTENHGGWDYWIVKLDANGTILWQKSLGGTNNDAASSIQTTSDGGYIVAGISKSSNGDVTENHGNNDAWVVKLDAIGTIQWQKSLGGSNNESVSSIETTADGGFIMVGYSSSNDGDVAGNHGSADCWIVKLDAIGNIEWQNSMGGTQYDYALAIKTTIDGGYVVTGNSFSNNGDISLNYGDSDYWIVKLDTNGAIQWQKSLGGSSGDIATSFQITTDGGYIIAGATQSNDGDITNNHGYQDFWIVRLAPDTLGTSTFNKDTIVIYPNPVRSILNIQSSSLAQISKVKIIDVQGKIVLEQTQNTNTISVENLAKGFYILETYSGNQKHVSKFIKE